MQQTQIDLDLLSGPHAFWDGLIQMRERISGHRSGTDAVLLSACLPPDAKGLVVDLGCGSGVVGLGAVARHADLHAILVDNDPFMAALCQMNARENGLAERVRLSGGAMEIFSQAGQGTRIHAEFPLPVPTSPDRPGSSAPASGPITP